MGWQMKTFWEAHIYSQHSEYVSNNKVTVIKNTYGIQKMADQYATLASASSEFGNKQSRKRTFLSASPADSPKVSCEALPGSSSNQGGLSYHRRRHWRPIPCPDRLLRIYPPSQKDTFRFPQIIYSFPTCVHYPRSQSVNKEEKLLGASRCLDIHFLFVWCTQTCV